MGHPRAGIARLEIENCGLYKTTERAIAGLLLATDEAGRLKAALKLAVADVQPLKAENERLRAQLELQW